MADLILDQLPFDEADAGPAAAGFWPRLVAGLLDLLIALVVTSPLSLPMASVILDKMNGAIAHPEDRQINLIFVTILVGLNAIVLGTLLNLLVVERLRRASAGKRIMKLIVISRGGARLSMAQTCTRAIFLLIFAAVLFIWDVLLYFPINDIYTVTPHIPRQLLVALLILLGAAFIMLGLNCLSIAFSKSNRAWHDKLAGTRCVQLNNMVNHER